MGECDCYRMCQLVFLVILVFLLIAAGALLGTLQLPEDETLKQQLAWALLVLFLILVTSCAIVGFEVERVRYLYQGYIRTHRAAMPADDSPPTYCSHSPSSGDEMHSAFVLSSASEGEENNESQVAERERGPIVGVYETYGTVVGGNSRCLLHLPGCESSSPPPYALETCRECYRKPRRYHPSDLVAFLPPC